MHGRFYAAISTMFSPFLKPRKEIQNHQRIMIEPVAINFHLHKIIRLR
jgi:hypothetical protein